MPIQYQGPPALLGSFNEGRRRTNEDFGLALKIDARLQEKERVARIKEAMQELSKTNIPYTQDERAELALAAESENMGLFHQIHHAAILRIRGAEAARQLFPLRTRGPVEPVDDERLGLQTAYAQGGFPGAKSYADIMRGPDEPVVSAVGPDGNPVFVPRSKAPGMTPYSPERKAESGPETAQVYNFGAYHQPGYFDKTGNFVPTGQKVDAPRMQTTPHQQFLESEAARRRLDTRFHERNDNTFRKFGLTRLEEESFLSDGDRAGLVRKRIGDEQARQLEQEIYQHAAWYDNEMEKIGEGRPYGTSKGVIPPTGKGDAAGGAGSAGYNQYREAYEQIRNSPSIDNAEKSRRIGELNNRARAMGLIK